MNYIFFIFSSPFHIARTKYTLSDIIRNIMYTYNILLKLQLHLLKNKNKSFTFNNSILLLKILSDLFN